MNIEATIDHIIEQGITEDCMICEGEYHLNDNGDWECSSCGDVCGIEELSLAKQLNSLEGV